MRSSNYWTGDVGRRGFTESLTDRFGLNGWAGVSPGGDADGLKLITRLPDAPLADRPSEGSQRREEGS